MTIDIDSLNPAQREAVLCTEGPLLVLAGAGSGKTRVLTYRIANMLENNAVFPWEILAITFTNKAAAEMRERLGALVGPAARGMWVSTFHSMCVRMLRADAERLGYTKNFTIYADDDSKRLYKDIMAELDIDPRRIPVNTLRNRISQAKNELLVPAVYAEQAKDPIGKIAARVYTRLEERLKAANAFDFDDLLLYAYLLLKNHPDVLEAYQERFRYLLIDEYQDTNHAQYAITSLLAAKHKNIMVVGDDDQSIYSWRGADIRNILEFENDYPEAQVVKLEQNYRSVGNVLAAANAVIANNTNRKEKRLFTAEGDGEKIGVYVAADERDEGRWIAGEIEKRHAAGFSYNQMAVFYRTNAQSRVLEDMLVRAGVPYRIIGGTRFFDRAEIRDVMAYLTLAVNPADSIAAKRVINVPRRGIGKTTVDYIEEEAARSSSTFMEAAACVAADEAVRPATRRALAEFIDFVKRIGTYGGDLRKLIEAVVDESGLVDALHEDGTEEALARVENIKELLGVVDEFVDTHADIDAEYAAPTVVDAAPTVAASVAADHAVAVSIAVGSAVDELTVAASIAVAEPVDAALTVADAAPAVADPDADSDPATAPTQTIQAPARVLSSTSLADFIEWVTLRTDLDTMSDDGHAVTLMTVHASKGLEFDCVFVAGMEETLFPHGNSSFDPAGIEEERRLAYVAITRARKVLHLSCANSRKIFGESQANPISRFVNEIPSELRRTTGVGSAGFSGMGWEKRGSRRGISGSGTEAGGGRVSRTSSASGAAGRSLRGTGGSSRGAGSSSREGDSSFSSSLSAGAANREKINLAVGDLVDHKTFGRGKVVSVDGDKVQVRFSKLGTTKKLMVDFAPIVKIEG